MNRKREGRLIALLVRSPVFKVVAMLFHISWHIFGSLTKGNCNYACLNGESREDLYEDQKIFTLDDCMVG